MEEENSIIVEFVNAKNWNGLIQYCEDHEITVDGDKVKPHYGVLLLSYLIIGDLNNARFLWKRIPEEDRLPEHHAIWEVGKDLWKRNYQKAHYVLETYTFPSMYTKLIEEFKDSFRERVFQLFSKSYHSISSDKAQQCLGFKSVEETNEFVGKRGWKLQDDKQHFIVNNEEVKSQQRDISLDQLQKLAEYVLCLESF